MVLFTVAVICVRPVPTTLNVALPDSSVVALDGLALPLLTDSVTLVPVTDDESAHRTNASTSHEPPAGTSLGSETRKDLLTSAAHFCVARVCLRLP